MGQNTSLYWYWWGACLPWGRRPEATFPFALPMPTSESAPLAQHEADGVFA